MLKLNKEGHNKSGMANSMISNKIILLNTSSNNGNKYKLSHSPHNIIEPNGQGKYCSLKLKGSVPIKTGVTKLSPSNIILNHNKAKNNNSVLPSIKYINTSINNGNSGRIIFKK